jgi:hypothetical protein
VIVSSSNKGHSEDLLTRSFGEELRERVGDMDGERGMMAAGNSLLASSVLIAHSEAGMRPDGDIKQMKVRQTFVLPKHGHLIDNSM